MIASTDSHSENSNAQKLDSSLWSLIVSNCLVIAIAAFQENGLHSLLLVFWLQSVIIGISNVFRILSLEKFSTKNFRMNGRPVEPTPSTKRQVAFFFAIHYGVFHVVYLMFLMNQGESLFDHWFWISAVVFGFNHYYSYQKNKTLDRRGHPNIGAMMFTPYLRVVPMHLCIVLGVVASGTLWGLFVFGGLKTAADVTMHMVEHARLRRKAES